VREADFESKSLNLALKSLCFNFGIVTGLEVLCSGIVAKGTVGEVELWRVPTRRRFPADS
jgi:hypothetical protein